MIVGQCIRCGRPATRACPLCGQLYCSEHMSATERVCADCAGGARRGRAP